MLLLVPLLLAVGPDDVDFAREVLPVLARNCFACHGPDEEAREAELRLDIFEGATASRGSGLPAIAPGDAAGSGLIRRVRHEDPAERMPPPDSGHELTSEEIDVLARWIGAGAEYERHWAFVPPRRPEVPAVAGAQHPVDAFVRARLAQAGLAPSARADRRTLLRRLSIDLIGLPPSVEELRAFEQDRSPHAYARAVDRLLESPRFGERWASMWLDLARYADSSGYGSDPLRTIWRYRDWVIEAFNANLPYDEFTRLQLAGDLLPDPSEEDILATAFHRNTMTNTEGGTDDEEFRVAAVKDRINTTMQVWMGLTAGCASCHTHKFDPISHHEYYSLFAYFNQTEDTDKNDDRPRLRTPTRAHKARLAALDAEEASLRERMLAPDPVLDAAELAWEASRGEGWVPLAIERAESREGAPLNVTAPGEVRAGGEHERDETTLTGRIRTKDAPTALRLDALADESFPRGGPGLSPDNGNFVLSELTLELLAPPEKNARVKRVRVDLPGAKRILSLAEVEVWSGAGDRAKNVAPDGGATQSSTGYDGPASFAIDGNTSGVYTERSVTHTNTESDPWWEVELARAVPVDRVDLWNRTDGSLEERLAGAVLTLFDAEDCVVWSTTLPSAPTPELEVAPATWPVRARLFDPRAGFSQDKWGVATAIDGDRGRGWAIGPRMGKDHVATFRIEWPAGALERAEGRVAVGLLQDYGDGHRLGRVRVSFTTEDPPQAALDEAIQSVLDVPREERDGQQARVLREYFRGIANELQPLRDDLAGVERRRAAISVPDTPVLRELPQGKRRKTYVLEKGNFLLKADEVHASLPEAFHDAPDPSATADRLALAEWLVGRENPLTARVAVNRFWSQLFGSGIVETEDDFGAQGTQPSHPELLDWMAIEFMDSGWDMKALLRLLVTSETYRQSAAVTAELEERDPRNRLHARALRLRLSAEAVRDHALAVSGLLSPKMFGPSVYPPQPAGMWQAAFNGQRNWPTSRGEDRYRRGLYVFLRRTVPYPSLATFDAPNRVVCTVRRARTNTPLQTFVTLNDPAFVECARALARRLIGEPGTLVQRVSLGYELVTGHVPDDARVATLATLFTEERAAYAGREADARDLVDARGAEISGDMLIDLAAWTVVANVLLNLDAALVRG